MTSITHTAHTDPICIVLAMIRFALPYGIYHFAIPEPKTQSTEDAKCNRDWNFRNQWSNISHRQGITFCQSSTVTPRYHENLFITKKSLPLGFSLAAPAIALYERPCSDYDFSYILIRQPKCDVVLSNKESCFPWPAPHGCIFIFI